MRTLGWSSLAILSIALAGSSADAAPKKKKPPRSEAPKTEIAPDFDKQAAAAAIAEVTLDKCKATNAAKGEGHVVITFAPHGAAQRAVIDKGPWVGTPIAKCMVKQFKKAKVPAFNGEAITVGKSFRFG